MSEDRDVSQSDTPPPAGDVPGGASESAAEPRVVVEARSAGSADRGRDGTQETKAAPGARARSEEPTAAASSEADRNDESLSSPASWSTFAKMHAQEYRQQQHRRNTRVFARTPDFVDPTQPLTRPTNPLLDIDEARIDAVLATLDSKRIVLVISTDEVVLYSVTHAIAARRTTWEHRELSLNTLARSPDHVVRLPMLLDPQVGKGSSTIVFVSTAPGESDAFLQSLPSTSSEFDRLHSGLGVAGRHVVVLVSPERLPQSGREVAARLSYAVSIDFVGPRLRARFPDSWVAMAVGVWCQYEDGLWGKSESELLDRIEKALQADTFESEYTQCDQALRDPGVRATIRQRTIPVPVLDDPTPLQTAACFVGAYFRKLRTEDFQRILLGLIGDAVEPAGASPADRAGREATIPPPRALKQIWIEQRRRIMRDCLLRVSKDSPPTVDFERAETRAEVQRRFESEHRFAYDDLCRAVDAHGWFFDERRDVADAAMALVLRRVQSDPMGYGETFLGPLLLPLAFPLGSLALESLSIRELFARLTSASRARVLGRFALLVSLLSREGAGAQAESALAQLLEAGSPTEVLDVLPRVTDPSFAERRLALAKRLVDEGNESIHARTYDQLLRSALEGGAPAAALMTALDAWADGGTAPHASILSQVLIHMIEWAATSSVSLATHPLASALLALKPGDDRVRLIGRIARLTGWLPANDLPRFRHAATLLLTFLWIVPRSADDEATEVDTGIWEVVQSAWFEGVVKTLDAALRDGEARYSRTFAAMALADCTIALSEDPAAAAAGREAIAAALRVLSSSTVFALRANWRGMDQGLLRCLAAVSSLQATDKLERARQAALRDRCQRIRAGLRALLEVFDSTRLATPHPEEHTP